MAVLAVSFIGYLIWLHFAEVRRLQKEQRQRARERRGRWGYV